MIDDYEQRKGLCCSKPLIMPLKEHVLRIITTKLKVDKLVVNMSCVIFNPMFGFRIIFRVRGFICLQYNMSCRNDVRTLYNQIKYAIWSFTDCKNILELNLSSS